MIASAELAFTLIAATGAVTMSIFQTNNLIDSALTMGTGQYMAKLASAVDTYVFDNFTTLAGSPSGPTTLVAGSVSATVSNPLQPTVQDLINLKLLPLGTMSTAPMGMSFAVNLTPTNCSAGLTNCTIPGLMYSTTAYRDGSGNVRTDLLTAVVAAAGYDAGVSYAESPALITGMAAKWSTANPVAGNQVGVLAMQVGSTSLLAQSLNQFYKRDGSLNLTGPMDANNQAMNRVGNIQSNGAVSANGNVSGNGVYGNYVQSNGSALVQGVMQANQVNANLLQSNGNVTSAGSMVANGYLFAAGAVVPSSGAGQQVWAGWGCGDPQGSIRSDPNGVTLSCQNGVWQPASGSSNGVVVSSAMYCDNLCHYGICITQSGSGGFSYAGNWVCYPNSTFVQVGPNTMPGS
ncbi:adhesin (plasmid) [Cupriavidus sp. USMAHM13]|uniref:adhesin n=1 Tax=Cupriavidus sp. USMAHM13 TaxID=1389192 RepID=UPI0008A6E0CB|nr:adhesin [Cupriavidus sp. USMAHM13]AOZ04255.1 adhesin [Cupriavidus sp. USMAHM13]